MTYNELALMVQDLMEAIASFSRDDSDENWQQIISKCIQIDSAIEMSYPQESNQNDRISK